MATDLVADLILAFLFLVAASYAGTMAALRRYFGRESYDADAGRFTNRHGGGDVPAESYENGE